MAKNQFRKYLAEQGLYADDALSASSSSGDITTYTSKLDEANKIEDKIKIANNLLKMKSIKAEQLEYSNIPNLIFSINNMGKHYVTIIKKTTWYCYKVLEFGLPKNEVEIKQYCSIDSVHKSLHDTDYNCKVKLVCGTEDSIDKLINWLS